MRLFSGVNTRMHCQSRALDELLSATRPVASMGPNSCVDPLCYKLVGYWVNRTSTVSGIHTMSCKIAASRETLVASRAVKSLRWWISACPGWRSDTVGHLRCAWVPSGKIGVLHQRHPSSRVRLRSVSHALVHVRHLAERRTVGRI